VIVEGLLPRNYKIPQTIFWWVFTLAGVFAFFFSYGMVEDLIRE